MDTKTTSFIALTAILAVAAFVGAGVSRQGESSFAAPSQAGGATAQANNASTLIGVTTAVAQGVNEQLVNCTNPATYGRSLIGRMVSCSPTN